MPPSSGSNSYLLRDPAGISTKTTTWGASTERNPRIRGLNLRALVLWDIDGTLVDSAKLGRDAFLVAFERVTGAPPAQLVPFAGRTDLEIAADLLEQSGVAADDGVVDAFEDALAAAMAELEDELRRRGRAYPGAQRGAGAAGARARRRAGAADRQHPGERAGEAAAPWASTGWWTSTSAATARTTACAPSWWRSRAARAERKLGCPGAARAARCSSATRRWTWPPRTPGGARAIGVATGPFSERELEEAGAETVLPDLRDAERLVAAVLAVG